jgi:hypothetical protein
MPIIEIPSAKVSDTVTKKKQKLEQLVPAYKIAKQSLLNCRVDSILTKIIQN